MDKLHLRLSLMVGLFALTALGVRATTRQREAHKRTPDWNAVPYDLSGWKGTEASFDPVYGTDPADTSLLRIYASSSRAPVIAYVGFFSDLAAITEVHTPELCYPAQGWTIVSSSRMTAGTFRGLPIKAQEILVDKMGEERLVIWWYNAGPRPFENRIRYVYAMLALSSITGRSDGSMVRLETPIGHDGEAAAALGAESFRDAFLPALERALPN